MTRFRQECRGMLALVAVVGVHDTLVHPGVETNQAEVVGQFGMGFQFQATGADFPLLGRIVRVHVIGGQDVLLAQVEHRRTVEAARAEGGTGADFILFAGGWHESVRPSRLVPTWGWNDSL